MRFGARIANARIWPAAVLSEMGLRERPEILVFNKLDCLAPDEGSRIAAHFGGVAISAAQPIGFTALLERAESELFESQPDAGGALPAAFAVGERGVG